MPFLKNLYHIHFNKLFNFLTSGFNLGIFTSEVLNDLRVLVDSEKIREEITDRYPNGDKMGFKV